MKNEHPLTSEFADNTPHTSASKSAKKSRGKFVGFWADDALHEQITSDAAASGLTVSDYLRELSSGEPVPRKRPAPHAARVEVGKFLGHLGRCGSNLNQLAHQTNRAALIGEWDMMPKADEVLAACAALNVLLQDIRTDLKKTIGRKR